MENLPVIKIEVTGTDPVEVMKTLGSVYRVAAPKAEPLIEDLPLDKQLEHVRKMYALQGFAVRIVKMDAKEETPEPEPMPEPAAVTYEPKAVKRRGRRSKAEIEAEKAAAQAALEPQEVEASDDEPGDMPFDSDESPVEVALSDAELEAFKKETIKRIWPVYNSPGGKERIEEVKRVYGPYSSVATIPAKHFPDLARRLGL